jgi:hypothetical protein
MTKDMRHASEMSGVGVADKDVAFEISSFTEPESISIIGILVDINVSIRSVLPVHAYKSRGFLASGNNDRHGSVKRAFATNGVARKILVIEIVRDISLSIFKEKAGGSFGKSIKGVGGESKVSSDIFIEFKTLLSINFKDYFLSIVGSGDESNFVRIVVNNDFYFGFC